VKAASNLAVMALSAAIACLLVTDDAANAQSGSTGGTVGKTDKSASGGGEEQPAPAHGHSAAHHRAASPRTEGPRLRGEKGSLASYNGAWTGASFGQCIVNGWQWNVQIAAGNISGTTVTGRVFGGGGVSGEMMVFGTTYDFKGHLNSSQGSGTWLVRSGAKAGCTGTWTISRS